MRTGRCSPRVESSSTYYWIDGRGDILGTDFTRPSLDFRELLTVTS